MTNETGYAPLIPSAPRWDPALRLEDAHTRRIIPVQEYGELDIALTDLVSNGRLAVYEAVRGHGYLDIRLASTGNLRVSAGHWVGLIPLTSSVTIRVTPRAPVRNLARIVSVARGDATVLELLVREYADAAEVAESIVEALARSLLRSMAQIEQRGVHRAYVRRQEDTSFPRGRLAITDTIVRQMARGVTHRANCSWFEYSADTAPNRLLRYALHWLFHRYRAFRERSLRRMLVDVNRLDHVLAEVTIDHSRRFLEDPLVQDPAELPATRSYYAASMRLAKALIAMRGIAPETEDDLLAESVVLDLEDVFERYLRAVLQREFNQVPGVAVLDGNRAPGRSAVFDQDPNTPANPDVVLRRAGGAPDVIVEVKYMDREPSRDEINQAVTYAMVYRSREVILVHPARGPRVRGLYRINTIGNVRFYFYAFDAAAPELELEERQFAACVKEVASAP